MKMTCKKQRIFGNIANFVKLRECFVDSKLDTLTRQQFISSHLPPSVKERELSLGEIDKVFASAWLDSSHVICGTKCNKLVVLNVLSGQTWSIPLLEGGSTSLASEKNCGIHSIAICPEGNVLATGGQNPNNVAVYKLPSLEPICVGEFHNDWIFCQTWISPTVLAAGSRDGSISIWSINPELSVTCSPPLKYSLVTPSKTLSSCQAIDRVRSMVYSPRSNSLAAISSNGYIHIWDAKEFRQVLSSALPFTKENVCLTQDKTNRIYAVGSLSHISLLDSRSGRPIGSICSKDHGAGVRSLSFLSTVMTIGTGMGSIMFYDLRINRFLERADGSPCFLKVGRGWLRHDSIYREYFWDSDCYPNAVYTHCYDPTETKMFAAGGPLALGLYGSYSAVWD